MPGPTLEKPVRPKGVAPPDRAVVPARPLPGVGGTPAPAPLLCRPLVQAAIVLAVCGVVYWTFLGRSGFAYTEGHRVVPAWEMLDSGDWLLSRMFERVYLRKPPGMSWSVALSSLVLGRTEFAARAVSALATTLSCLLVLVMARRWFGARAGLGAGLAQALTPLWWSTGRSAEIEALNNLGTQAGVLLLLELLVRRPRHTMAVAAGAGAGVLLAGIAKGPTGVPCLVGALAGACLAVGSIRVIARRELVVALGLPALILGAVGAAVYSRVSAVDQSAITQSVLEFLWNADRVAQVFTMAPLALISALPASLALGFPWGKAAKAEYAGRAPHDSPYVMARALAITCLGSLLLLSALGVGNPRHAMPALTGLAPLVGYVVVGIGSDFVRWRALAGRVLLFWAPWVLPVILTAGGVGFAVWSEARRDRISGRGVGMALGELLPDGSEVWADGAVEARPEVLAYAARRSAELGRTIRPRWVSLAGSPVPASGPGRAFLLLRADDLENETDGYARRWPEGSLTQVGEWSVYKYRFRLVETSGVSGER